MVNKKLGITDMRQIAEMRGGKCLSTVYLNNKSKLKWECAEGHKWEAKPEHIRNRGQWCKICSIKTFSEKRKLKIENIKIFATQKGGQCLSHSYINSRHKLTWQCVEGHIWDATAGNVINNDSWCPECANNRSLTIEDMHKIAHARNGKCLSDKYVNYSTKLTWQCVEGHIWDASPASVKNRYSWCPTCGKFYFLNEEICRTTLEQIFEKPFPKSKPNWLINNRGNRMELDGFCEQLSLAFEFQGSQHFQLGYFTENEKQLEQRLEDDKVKKKICASKGVNLLIFDYEMDLNYLPRHIKDGCQNTSLEFANVNFGLAIDFDKMFHHREIMKEIKRYASTKGGVCLSTKFINSKTHLTWQCSEGHEWKAAFGNMKQRNSWCQKCNGNARLDIEAMHELAALKNGQCLSSEYKNSRTKLKWECEKGHIFESRPKQVRRGEWCNKCSRNNRLTIEEMQVLAIAKNGLCLSTEYINSGTKLTWQCEEGHVWDAAPRDVKRGSWCGICFYNRKKC